MSRRDLIDVAMGRAPADLLIRGGNLVNVSTGEIYPAEVAIKGERIAAVGDVGYAKGEGTEILDAGGRFLTPGLIDGHLHSYHSYLGAEEFTEGLLRHGVTATADGFYGQGIVGGMEAIRFFKEAFERMPIRLIFLVPVLSYLQNRELGLTPANGIEPDEMIKMLDWPNCYGVEEPPFLPIVEKYEEFLELFEATLERRKVITGHAAGIDFRAIQAYAAMGAATDHEAVDPDDAVAKARAGIKLLIRQGSGCYDVPEVDPRVHRAGHRPARDGLLRRRRIAGEADERGRHRRERARRRSRAASLRSPPSRWRRSTTRRSSTPSRTSASSRQAATPTSCSSTISRSSRSSASWSAAGPSCATASSSPSCRR